MHVLDEGLLCPESENNTEKRQKKLENEKTKYKNKKSENQKKKEYITITPIVTKGVSSPRIGSRKEIIIECANKNTVRALLDTGAPTSFVHSNLVRTLDLPVLKTTPLHFRGAVSPNIATTTSATTVEFIYNKRRYTLEAYVTPCITQDFIIGNPILEEYPSLLHGKRDSPRRELIDVYEIDCVQQEDLGRHFEEPSELFVVQVNNTTASVGKANFIQLPGWLQQKYRNTVRNDLPPREFKEGMVQHEIDLKIDARMPRLQPYRLTPKLEEEAQELVKDLLAKKFITPSKSPYSSPIVLVKKKDGTYRMCVDYRILNKATVKDPFPLPRIEVLLAKVGGARCFSTIDLHSGYHQITLKKEDQHKTAFVTPNGKYEYRVMPFGLVNAPSTFARYMSDLFRDLPYVCVYLDDILIFSNSNEDHWKHLDEVLRRLQKESLVAKLKKCHFAQTKVEYLGYVIGHNSIEPVHDKCTAIKEFPTPKTIKDAQRFLGMINYYRRFIKDCSKFSRPIIEFITKNATWSEDQEIAFSALKTALMNKPLLVPFKTDAEYRLTTDASKEGLGAVLEEIESTKIKGVVGYFSKTLVGAQKNYPAGELELLAIIESLRHFRYVLHGKQFVLRTDHISLLSLNSKKEPSRRIATWMNELSEYDFRLEYLAGPKNVVADAISRAGYTEVAALDNITRIAPQNWLEDWKSDALSAAALLQLGIIEESSVPAAAYSAFKKYEKRFRLSPTFRGSFTYQDDILRYRDRIIAPASRYDEVLTTYHDHTLFGGHFGTQVTYAKIAERFYWPHLFRTVDRYVKSCIQCQVMKAHRPQAQGLLRPLPIAEGRWLDISMDFLTGLPLTTTGNDMILVVVDRFSKRAHFIACDKSLTSQGTLDLLFRYVFAYHGFPHTITSDRDIRFTSKAYSELTKRLGITLTMSTSNHPQTDGQSERCIQVLNRLLRTYAEQLHQNWDRLLPQIEFVYNATHNTAVHDAPFKVDLGYIPNEPVLNTDDELSARHFGMVELTKQLKAIELRTREFLSENQVTMETSANRRRREVDISVGDYVLLHREAYFNKGRYTKVQPIYLGPFKVVKVLNNAFELDLPTTSKVHRVINVQWVKKFIQRTEQYPKQKPRTHLERVKRVNEISAVVGYDKDNKIYYCRMTDVDPTIAVEFSEEEFNTISQQRRSSLINNFNQLLETTAAQEEREDVME